LGTILGIAGVILAPPVRRFALAVHLTCSVGWIGAVISYIGLGVAAVTASSPDTVRGTWIAMELVGWYVLVPLAVGSWLTGLVMALGTKWGLFRYYWVLFAFVLTTLAAAVLIAHMPDVSAISDALRTSPSADVEDHGGDLFHAVLALVLLLAIHVPNLYKPPGMMRYGWRKKNAGRVPLPPREASS
jgi:hypothetical protein